MADYVGTNTGAAVDAAVDAVEYAKAADLDDSAVGRLLKVGDFGMAGYAVPAASIDSIISGTISGYSLGTTGVLPTGSSGSILTMSRSGRRQVMLAISDFGYSSTPNAYIASNDGTAFADWQEIATSANDALIESGSNANGNYTKFPDGTLICRIANASSSSGVATWTFPSAFIATPQVSATIASADTANYSCLVASKSATAVTYNVWSGATRVAKGVDIIAIGVWK